MLTEALKYLSLGWSLIPLKPKSKEPLIKWQEFQSRRATEQEVREWHTKWPLMNLGAVTGSISGFCVIDLDGPEGLASGQRLGLKSPMVSLTGNGRQLWYLNEAGIQNSVKQLGAGVDVRGEGGYVVLPPSVHPNSKNYRWLSPIHASSVASLLPVPAHLIVKDVPQNGLDANASVRKEPDWVIKALEEMTLGNIDTTLHRVCSYFRNFGVNMEVVRGIIQPYADKAGATEGHLEDKIRNVWGRYEPRAIQSTYGKSSNISLVLHSPSNPDSLDEYRKRTSGDALDESIRTGYTAFDTLTKGLRKGEVLTIAARTGVGKTNWVITPIRTFCETGKRVLLFSTEMSFDQIWQRYQAVLESESAFRSHQLFICDEFTPDIERIEEAIKNVSPDLFIFDHISHIGTDYHIISKFMSEIKRLARLYNIPAIVTAQLNRNADYVDQGQRVEPRLSMIQGSDQIGQMSAQVLLLNEKRIVEGDTEIEGIVVKNRHGDKGMCQFVLKSKPFYRMEEA